MGREPRSCDPFLIKTNWFDKRYRVNAYKEIWVLILNSNISYFNTTALYANFNSSYQDAKIWINAATVLCFCFVKSQISDNHSFKKQTVTNRLIAAEAERGRIYHLERFQNTQHLLLH